VAGTVALAVCAAIWLTASPRRPEPSFDLTVATTVAPAVAAAPVSDPTPAPPAPAPGTAVAESHVVVETPAGAPPSATPSGRIVVTNNGTAIANTGGNVGQNITTGRATAIASDSVVVIK